MKDNDEYEFYNMKNKNEDDDEYNDDSNDESDDESDDDSDDEEFDDESDDDSDDESDKLHKRNKRKYDDIKKNKKDENINQIFENEINKLNVISSNTIIKKYFKNVEKNEKNNIIKKIKEINNYNNFDKPLFNRLLLLKVSINEKSDIINKYYNSLQDSNSYKLKEWVNNVVKIPFGKYYKSSNMSKKNVKLFLDDLNSKMTKAILGHNEAKNHILQIMAQKITNPESKGNIIGIYGPPGNGKTTLIKEGIAKAINKPFNLISLGGATHGSFLDGHSYTWEGAVHGRIIEALILSKCMDPIIYFDELDKISNTPSGKEIENVLIHLTDPIQNNQFKDKYFEGISFDLSKVTFIFSYNDPSKINKILLDRLTQIETSSLLLNQKIDIMQNYSIPEILKDIGFKNNSIIMSNNIIENMITTYTREGGVRGIKKLIYEIFREINISVLTNKIKLPLNITNKLITSILKNKNKIIHEKIDDEDKIGLINGLYASDNGNGGILPIELAWYPAGKSFEIKTTGNLKDIIKESAQVASTLAFNNITKELQEYYNEELQKKSKGIHIHFSDGSMPKEGPSAGTALAVGIYSLLTESKIKKDIAITGEISLNGKVSEIGGLNLKLQGAKNAGIKLVLYPYDNEKDINLIKETNPTLFDESFKIISIKTFEEALKYSIVND
jgi:endopeptidase La